MAYWERSYHVGVILGSACSAPLWTWERWRREVAPTLTPLVSLARDNAAVRTIQFEADGKTPIRFGRIGWNDAGHQKWIHCSPANALQSSAWGFLTAELWAPSWTKSDREPPDLFFGMRNLAYQASRVAFDHLVILAVAADIAPDSQQRTERASHELSGQLQPGVAMYQQRTWGKPMGTGFFDAIGDMLSVGLFKLGDPQQRPMDETTLSGAWRRLRDEPSA